MTLTPTPLPEGEGPKILRMPDSRPIWERGLGGEGNGTVIELTLIEVGAGTRHTDLSPAIVAKKRTPAKCLIPLTWAEKLHKFLNINHCD